MHTLKAFRFLIFKQMKRILLGLAFREDFHVHKRSEAGENYRLASFLKHKNCF